MKKPYILDPPIILNGEKLHVLEGKIVTLECVSKVKLLS